MAVALRLADGRLEAAPPEDRALSNMIFNVGRRKQSLTDRVQYTLECPGDSVELRLIPFAAGREARTIRLTPTYGRHVVAKISHLPATRIASTNGQIGHVAAIYQLLDPPPATRGVPSVAERLRVDGTWDNPPECAPPLVFHWRGGPAVDPLPPDPAGPVSRVPMNGRR